MRTALAKWGNSLAVRIPRHMAENIQCGEGSAVDLQIIGETIVVSPARPRYRLGELLAKFKPEHRVSETDWGRPVGEEVW